MSDVKDIMESYYTPVTKFNMLRSTLKALNDRARDIKRCWVRIDYNDVTSLYNDLYGVEKWIGNRSMVEKHLERYASSFQDGARYSKMEVDYFRNSRDISYDHLNSFGFGHRLLRAADHTGYWVIQGENAKNRMFAWIDKANKVVSAICVSDEKIYRYLFIGGTTEWDPNMVRVPLIVMSAILKNFGDTRTFNFSDHNNLWTNTADPGIVINGTKIAKVYNIYDLVPANVGMGLFEIADMLSSGKIPKRLELAVTPSQLDRIGNAIRSFNRLTPTRRKAIMHFLECGKEAEKIFNQVEI